jgi:ATP synthase protein I
MNMNDQQGGGDPSFEDRLSSARIRRGLDSPAAGPEKKLFSPWGIGLRVGTELVSALVVALAIGWALDRWLGTKPILLAVFVLIGGAAGVANIWRLFKQTPTG